MRVTKQKCAHVCSQFWPKCVKRRELNSTGDLPSVAAQTSDAVKIVNHQSDREGAQSCVCVCVRALSEAAVERECQSQRTSALP